MIMLIRIKKIRGTDRGLDDVSRVQLNDTN